jgi:hypothetical protein
VRRHTCAPDLTAVQVEVEIVKDAYAHTEFEEKLAEVHERARSALAHAKERLSPSHAKKA